MTTTTSPRVRGHARTVTAVGVEQRGKIRRVARGYVVTCSCGNFTSPEVGTERMARVLHDDHKASL
jgi:hypothetical protein